MALKIDVNEVLNKPPGETKQVEMLGRKILEMAFSPENQRANEKYRKVFEDLGITEDVVKEATLTPSNNTALFTTAVAGFIEKAFRPKLLAEQIIKTLPLELKGHDSIKVPKGQNLSAVAVAEDGTITFDDKNYGDLTISVGWVGTGTTISHQLLSMGVISLLEDKAEEIGFAIKKKVDSDILAEQIKAGTKNDATYGDNSNYSYLGTGVYITYDTLVDAITNHEGLSAEPKAIICHPTDKARILKDSDIKSALAFGTTPSGTILPNVLELFDLKLLSTPQMTAGKIALVDTGRLGYYVDASPIQTWDGRKPSTIAFEIIGAKPYGVGITRPEAVYVIHENATEPA